MPAWFWYVMSGLLLFVIIANIWPKGPETPGGSTLDVSDTGRRKYPERKTAWEWAHIFFTPVVLIILVIVAIFWMKKH